MFRTLMRVVVAGLVLAGLGAVGAGVWFLAGGIGAREAPGRLEAGVARRLRALAIPGEAVARANPVPADAAALAAGMARFADRCASCHANDGSGDTEMGRSLYPRAPDMRAPATQGLSDGALFYIIENGVRLTGMPAWGTGTATGEHESWQIVHFIRHLPALTAAERQAMDAMNPRTAEEWRQQEELKRFLNGDEGREAPALAPDAAPHRTYP